MTLIVPGLRSIDEVDCAYAQDLFQLFQEEWWSQNRSIQNVHSILEASSMTFGVVDESDRLLAFARVLTDYVYFGFIFDLIVSTELRGRGVGSSLMQRILDHPQLMKVQSFEICCQPDTTSFYTKFGFAEARGRMRRVRPNADF